MKIIGWIISGIIGLLIVILLMNGFGFFNEKVNYTYQKAIDNVSYEK